MYERLVVDVKIWHINQYSRDEEHNSKLQSIRRMNCTDTFTFCGILDVYARCVPRISLIIETFVLSPS